MKKLLSVLLACVLVLGLAACGNDKQQNAGNNNQQEEQPVLRMATNAEFPPYEYYEGDKIVGIDAEVAAAIAEKLGMKLEIEDMAFDSTLMALSTGQTDMVMAGMTVTEERKENANFSTPYAEGHQVVIVKEDSEIETLDDLQGKKIGVQTNTTGDIYSTDDFGDEAVERYNKGADAVIALSQGLIDAVIIDLEPAKVFVATNDGLKLLETEYATEEYAIALNKENTELFEKVDGALQELIADGTVQEIVDRYINAE